MIHRKIYKLNGEPSSFPLIKNPGHGRPQCYAGFLFRRRDVFSAGRGHRPGGALAAQGADLLDIGGESTRPFSDPISTEEEIRTNRPDHQGLVKRISIPISWIPRKRKWPRLPWMPGRPWLMISAPCGFDPGLGEVAELWVPLILMHMQGTPVICRSSHTIIIC